MDEDTLDLIRPALDAVDRLAEMTPAARHVLEQQIGSVSLQLREAAQLVREFNDAEIAAWCEEGRTQAWVAGQCGVTQQTIAERYQRLGLVPVSNRGRPRGGRNELQVPQAPPVIPPKPESLDEPLDEPVDEPLASTNGNGKPRKGWMAQLQVLSRSLPFALRASKPPTDRIMYALRLVDEIREALEARLGGPVLDNGKGGMTQEEWEAGGAIQPVQEQLLS